MVNRCVLLMIALLNLVLAALLGAYTQFDLEFIVVDWLQGGVFDRLIDLLIAVVEAYLVLSAFVWVWLALRPAQREAAEDARLVR
jgi:hypothetical protein